MKISFHGAARQVTGSCHLVEWGPVKILVDCGLFQGGREIDEENRQPFGFDPASIDYLLLTHAHLDHCGRIPLLVKQGFRGEIITTSASRDLARIVMLDAAGLEEEEARWRRRKLARRQGGDHFEPLFTTLDALDALDHFGRNARYRKPLRLVNGIEAVFYNAGHILGSAAVELRLPHGEKGLSILFSGDLGGDGRVILRDPDPPPRPDILVMETTYGNRPHKQLEPSVRELYDAILDTFRRGGNVVIPSFALERSQEVLYYLREGVEKGILPASMQVFLDSPMAISATEIFRRHPECYDRHAAAILQSGIDPFSLPGLHFTRETAESIAINKVGGGAVIIAGSGMCTGGRVRHHLKHNLWNRASSIIFVGYAAKGTLARAIVDGAKRVHIFGEEIPVRASIHTIGGFSAHADCNQLYDWYRQTGRPRTTYLVHGEEEVMEVFAERLTDTRVVMPEPHQAFALD